MHTSVEKRALRIAESCGTLAVFHKRYRSGKGYGRSFSVKKSCSSQMQADDGICENGLAHASRFSFLGSQSTESPHACAVAATRRDGFDRRRSEPCSTIVCNRRMVFPVRRYFKDSC